MKIGQLSLLMLIDRQGEVVRIQQVRHLVRCMDRYGGAKSVIGP
ncbi:MAG: hypothetical protein AB7I01_01960 [Gammaproteobacteria bacterium]